MQEAILFLHGIPTRGCLWNGIVERLAGQFQCLAVDFPPHGFRNLPALAASLEQLRIEHQIEKWHVVGHDGGCAVAVHYAHLFPHRVGCLALLTPSMFPELKPFYLFEVLRKPVLGELLAPAINLLFWSVVMRRAVEGNHDAVRDFHAPFRGLRGPWRLMDLVRWGDPAAVLASIPKLLPEILAPTLVFHGLADSAVPEAFARRACELMPGSELIVLNCGHFLPLSQPVAIAQELLRFFNSYERSNAGAALAATTAGMPR
jgi:pimeloyl-ACP methyl ester carboxylesterase